MGFSQRCVSPAVMGAQDPSHRELNRSFLPLHHEAGIRGPGSMKGGNHHFLTDTLFYSKSQSSKHPARSQPQELREKSDCFVGFLSVL